MEQKSIKGFTPFGEFGLLLAFFGGGFIVTMFVQLAIIMTVMPSGTDMGNLQEAMLQAMADPKNVTTMRLMQAAGTFFLMFVPAFLFALLAWGKKPGFWLGFNEKVNPKQIVLALLLIMAGSLLASSLADLSKALVSNFPMLEAKAKAMEDEYNKQVLAMSKLDSWGEYFAALVIMALLPAIFEEVFFRGALQNIMVRWLRNPMAAIILTAFIFSLVHLSIFLFLSRAVLGLALGLIYFYSKNLWTSIAAHFFNNAFAVTQMWMLKLKGNKINVDDLDPVIPWWAGLLATFAFVGLCILYKKVSENNRVRVAAKEQLLIAESNPFNAFAKKENNYGA